MKREDVSAVVDKIKRCQGDPEIAHAMEDRLYLDLLRAFAVGAVTDQNEISILCELALETREFDFPRWCA